MSKIVYDKLIRDKVPEAIERTGKAFATHIISEDEYQLYLRHKLHEETTEYLESDDISELADLVEVIHALVKAKGFTWEDLEKNPARETRRAWWFRQETMPGVCRRQ